MFKLGTRHTMVGGGPACSHMIGAVDPGFPCVHRQDRVLANDTVFDRYNIVEEDDLRDAVKRIEAGIAKSSGASGQDLDKVKGG